MSSRALRKLQREQEQQRQLEKSQESSAQNEESEEEAVAKPKALNAFDMLTEDNDAGENISETAQSSEPDEVPVEVKQKEPVPTPPTKAKSKGKSRKKNKNRKSGKIDQGETSAKSKNKISQLDEIDLALKSLSTKDRDGTYAVTAPKPDEGFEELHRLLAVESKHLNALNEMKRLFGNVVLEGDEDQGVPGRRHGRGQRNLDLGGALAAQNSRVSRGQGLAGLALRRNVFMLGKEGWPKATSGGLGMEIVEKLKDGSTQYRFVHNTAYQDVQRQFESCVESMDPQRMIHLLQFNPYHISTLLQVSEIAKQQSDHSVSGDLLERALFSFGRSVHSSFSTALSEGKARLDFRRPENREFWLAAWRYIHSLGQRGTWRTAYEWAKLLLSLEPERDPYCVRLVLDHLALRGWQMEHFLSLKTCPMYSAAWENCPNIQISSALAEYKLKRSEACRASLLETIHEYPWMFARLFQELNIEPIPRSIWGLMPQSSRENFESAAYVNYAKDLWNSPDAISFLVEVAETAKSEGDICHKSDITLDEARHALLSGTPALISSIPRSYTTMSTSSSDPLPPPDTLPSYTITTLPERHTLILPNPPPNTTPASPEDEEQEPQGLQGFFSRIIPWLGRSDAPTEEALPTAATESGIPQEIIAESGTPLTELLRHVLGHRQQEQQALGARAQEVAVGEGSVGDEEDEEGFGPLLPEHHGDLDLLDPTNNDNDSAPSNDLASYFDSALYDDARNQRYLAGRGLLALRSAAAAYGTDKTSWPLEATVEVDGISQNARALLQDYARRVVRLERERERRFIMEFALPQGTSREVREMVVREVEGLGERGGGSS